MFHAQEERINELAIDSVNQQLKTLLDDVQFQEYLKALSNNSLVTSLKNQLDSMSGETLNKTFGYRKAAILGTLFAGAIVSFIGSLTFLVGERFPKEFGEFADIPIHDDTAAGFGKFLGWTNVAIEAIFYTWTISGILPSFEPQAKQDKLPKTNNLGFFRRSYNKLISYLPNIGEWGLAIASTIPLTFLSWIDEEKTDKDDAFKYSIVSSIAIITLVSNKYFLTLTHKQFKIVWNFLQNKEAELPKENNPNVLVDVKNAFLKASIRANEKLHHLSKDEFQHLINSLKNISCNIPDSEVEEVDKKWENLLSIVFEDLSFAPQKINKTAFLLVPGLAIFAALSWLGLIATVPNGVREKISSSVAIQYLLMVVAGIPLIEIGLSAGGSIGLKLSKIGNGFDPLITNLVGFKTRLLGYLPLGLFGLFSFGTNATLTVQEFKSVPAITWLLLPSATLGIDLINIFASIKLWDEITISVNVALNKDKQLYIKHQNFMNTLIRKVEETPIESLGVVFLKLTPSTQDRLKQLIPTIQEKNTIELVVAVAQQLYSKLPKKQKARRRSKKQRARHKPLIVETNKKTRIDPHEQLMLYDFNRKKKTKSTIGSNDVYNTNRRSTSRQDYNL